MSDAARDDEAIGPEELAELAADDLRAVFREVGPERAILALADAEPALRRRLLARWRPGGARDVEAGPGASPDEIRRARHAVAEAVCRLSRVGQIAFDHPDDILDQVA